MNVAIDKAIALLRVGNRSWNVSKIGKIRLTVFDYYLTKEEKKKKKKRHVQKRHLLDEIFDMSYHIIQK
jgi:hypothetical protein